MSKFPILTLPNYWTTPSLEVLHSLPNSALVSQIFSVQNQFGSISFIPKVNLSNIDLDSILEISQNSVTLYTKNSPPINTELNVPAIITLNNISPQSLSALKTKTHKQEAEFIEYDQTSGKFVFKVNHFTRYNFDVSESEEEEKIQLDFPIELSEEEKIDSNLKKNRNEEIEMQKNESYLEIKPLSLESNFKFSISPQGKFFLPSEKHLVAYHLNFNNDFAENALVIQTNELNPSHNQFIQNPIENLESYWLKLAQNFAREDFSQSEPNYSKIWSLFCALFGDSRVDLNEIFSMNIEKDLIDPQKKNLQRKKALVKWICYWEQKNVSGNNPYKNILDLTISGNIKQAVKLAIQSNQFIIANLLSQTSTSFKKQVMQDQIEKFQRSNIFTNFNQDLQSLYLYLAGHIDEIQNINWCQKLILLINSKFPRNRCLRSIFGELEDFVKGSHEELNDICYYLLEFYCVPSRLSAELFNPYNFQSYFSLGTSWLLYFSLYSLLLDSPEYENLSRSDYDSIFQDLTSLSISFSEELINNNKWALALYVLSFVENNESRVKDIIFRNIEMPFDKKFLIDYLKIDKNLIDEAEALREKNQFKFGNSFERYIQCGEFYQAFELVMSEIAPDLIIKYTNEDLYKHLYISCLQLLERHKHQIASWILSGEVYIEYLSLASVFSNDHKIESLEGIMRMQERIEKMFPQVFQLPKAVLKQKAAVGIMESSLNEWRLALDKMKEEFELFNKKPKIKCQDVCQNEELLRFTEIMSFRYLKNISKVM